MIRNSVVCDICGKEIADFGNYVEVRAEQLRPSVLLPDCRQCKAVEVKDVEVYQMHIGCFGDAKFVIGHVGKNLRMVAEDLCDVSQVPDLEQVD